MKRPKGLFIYFDDAEAFSLLSDGQLGALVRALVQYARDGEQPNLSDEASRMAFSFLSGRVDRDIAKYDEIVTKRQEAGQKGGRPPKANGSNENPKKQKVFQESKKSLPKGSQKEAEEKEESNCVELDFVDSSPVITLVLNDRSEFGILQSQVDEWQSLYPAVDVLQQLRSMKAWCVANPTKRKTKRGILRFCTAWLTREQDRGGQLRTLSDNGNSSSQPKKWIPDDPRNPEAGGHFE